MAKRCIMEMRLSPYPWVLSLWDDEAAMLAGIKKIEKDAVYEIEDCAGRCVTLRGEGHVAVGVFNGDFGTLVHELTHVLIQMFPAIGLKINKHTNEAAAYFMGHVFTECRNALNDHAAKFNKRKRRAK